jgi:hypothetical protein
MAEVEIHEEKVFTHLDEEKERDTRTWVLDTGAMNHMSGCRATFMKIDTMVLGTMHFSDDSVVRIEGSGTVMFVCKNGESRSFDGVYFIPHLMTGSTSSSPSEVRASNMLGGAWARRRGGVVLALALQARQHGGSPKAGSGGAGAWPTRDRSSAVVVQGVPGREAMTHFIPN